tara:strand:+ start:225 stop:449 length:225 start_codon:yes stop_codon:yes gene_type:complete
MINSNIQVRITLAVLILSLAAFFSGCATSGPVAKKTDIAIKKTGFSSNNRTYTRVHSTCLCGSPNHLFDDFCDR